MTRFLVTGVSGLLGLNFALRFSGEHEITGVVHQNRLGDVSFRVIQGDLTQPGLLQALVEQTKPEVILNCAALANVDTCESQSELAHRVNAEVPCELAKVARRSGIRLVHISIDAVFDGVGGNYTEEDHPNPQNTYARTKLAGEQAVLEANPDALIARVNFYGWSLSGQRSLAEHFFYNLSSGKKMKGFVDVFFCPLEVSHLAEILLRLIDLRLSGLYHVASGEALSKHDFGQRIAKRFGLDGSLIEPVSWKEAGLKAVRSPNLTLNIDKLRKVLGGEPPTQDQSLERFYELYRSGYPQKLHALRQ